MYFLFVQPCLEFPESQRYQLGLLSLIAQLRKAGHRAEYSPLYTGCQFERGFFNPEIDVIGIYTIECMTTDIKKFIDNNKNDFHILLGGPTATIAPNYCVEQLYFDSLLIGDGELAILEFAEKFNKPEFKQMNGFWFDCGETRNQPRPRLTQEELIQIEQPLRTEYLSAIQNRFSMEGKNTSIYATRGCPFSCTYCSNQAYNKLPGNILRVRTPEQVIAEIQTTLSMSKVKTIVFEDDILTMHKSWFKQLLKLFKKEFYDPHDIRFEMNTRVKCISKEQIKLAVDSGCYTIRFGVESGSELIRERMGRPGIKNQDMLTLADDILDAGLCLYFCSIIGVPPETPQLFEETKTLVTQLYEKTLKVNRTCYVILNTFYPLHGTALGDECYAIKWVKKKIQGIGSHVDYSLETPYMTREYILQQQQYFRENFTGMIPMEGKLYAEVRSSNSGSSNSNSKGNRIT